MYSTNEKKIIDKKEINDYKLKKSAISKIPKCVPIGGSKYIPYPNSIHKHYNISNLILPKQPSTISLKYSNQTPKRNASGESIPIIQTKKDYEIILGTKNLKYTFKKRLNSCGKSKSEKNDDSSCISRRNIKVSPLYNTKIEYIFLKQNIDEILKIKINSKNIDENNKAIENMNLKLKKILEKTNKYMGENGKKFKNSKESNKKMLNLCSEKFNKLKKRLEELRNSNYINRVNNEIEQIKNKINFYEKENKELLLKNNMNFNINTHKNNDMNFTTLPKIKNELDVNIDTQLNNKIMEYKNLIAQDIYVSKKIKNNELIIKNNEQIVENLNSKMKTLSNNYENGKFTEENEFNSINTNKNYSTKKRRIEINDKISEGKNPLVINKNIDFELNNLDKETKDTLNININKELSNINTLENYSKLEDNILSLPVYFKKKKNLSYSNITSNENNSNNKRAIKELILKNLDQKEKEEKTLINMHEENSVIGSSSNKFKFIRLKPNFSFNNGYYSFKNEKINNIPKLMSSVENKNNLIENLYNDKNREEIINESINVDESSEKNLDENKNDKSDKNKKIVQSMNRPNELVSKNREEDMAKKHKLNNPNNNNIRVNNKDEKNLHLNTTVEQREKALNTILYDNIYEQNTVF